MAYCGYRHVGQSTGRLVANEDFYEIQMTSLAGFGEGRHFRLRDKATLDNDTEYLSANTAFPDYRRLSHDWMTDLLLGRVNSGEMLRTIAWCPG